MGVTSQAQTSEREHRARDVKRVGVKQADVAERRPAEIARADERRDAAKLRDVARPRIKGRGGERRSGLRHGQTGVGGNRMKVWITAQAGGRADPVVEAAAVLDVDAGVKLRNQRPEPCKVESVTLVGTEGNGRGGDAIG